MNRIAGLFIILLLLTGCTNPIATVTKKPASSDTGRVAVVVKRPGGIAPQAISSAATHLRLRIHGPNGDALREIRLPDPGEEASLSIELRTGTYRVDVFTTREGRVYDVASNQNVVIQRNQTTAVALTLQRYTAHWSQPTTIYSGDTMTVRATIDGPAKDIWVGGSARVADELSKPADMWAMSYDADVSNGVATYTGDAPQVEAVTDMWTEFRLTAADAYTGDGMEPLTLHLPTLVQSVGNAPTKVHPDTGSVSIVIQ